MTTTRSFQHSLRAAGIVLFGLLGVNGPAFAQAASTHLAPVKATPVSAQTRAINKVQARPRFELSFIATADLLVGMRVLVDPGQPAGSGEFPVVFRREFTVTDDSFRQPIVWVPFKWNTQVQGVKSVEWQVVTTPMSDSLDNWEYPAGIIARGRSDASTGAAKDAYFVLDVKRIHELPPGFVLRRPPLQRRGATQIARTGAADSSSARAHTIRRIEPAAGAKLGMSAPIGQQLAVKNARFAGAMAELLKRRTYYVRIVLLNAGGRPVGASGYVTVRTGPPSTVVVYENALPPPYVAPDVNPPKVAVVGYTGPYVFSPGSGAGHFVVLGNCPKTIQDTFGWKPGMKVYLKPSGDDGGVLGAIVDAAGSVLSSFADLVNWFAEAWEDVKNGLVKGICFGNEDCAKVAMPLLNAGLVALGIPPEIPTFNDLCGLGADYLAAYIASQCPIPEAVAREGLLKVADIVNNPPGGSGGAFLWPDPDFQDRPAMVTLEVSNPGTEVTDPVLVRLGYGASGGEESGYPHLATFVDSRTPIPPLVPGQKFKIPVSLAINPEIKISHGADSMADYLDRNIQIYDVSTSKGAIFFSSANWRKHDVKPGQ